MFGRSIRLGGEVIVVDTGYRNEATSVTTGQVMASPQAANRVEPTNSGMVAPQFVISRKRDRITIDELDPCKLVEVDSQRWHNWLIDSLGGIIIGGLIALVAS